MLQHSPVLALGIMDTKVDDRIFMYMITFRRVLETKKIHLKVQGPPVNRAIWQRRFFLYFLREQGRGMMLPGGVAVNSVQFEMESWTDAQRAFAVKSFYKNNNSYVAAQREFRKKFGIHRNSKVPSAHAIKTWVNNFEGTGSTVKKKGGSVKTVRNPQNIDAATASFEQSQLCVIPRNWDRQKAVSGVFYTWICTADTGRDFKIPG